MTITNINHHFMRRLQTKIRNINILEHKIANVNITKDNLNITYTRPADMMGNVGHLSLCTCAMQLNA